MEELESAWEYLNGYVSMNYLNCSSFYELCDGFGVRKDGQKKEIWEVVRDGLLEYDKELRKMDDKELYIYNTDPFLHSIMYQNQKK